MMFGGRNFGQILPVNLNMQQSMQHSSQTEKKYCNQPIENLKRLTEEHTSWMGLNFGTTNFLRPTVSLTTSVTPVFRVTDFSSGPFLNMEHSNSPSQSPCSSASISLISRASSVLSVENSSLETWTKLLGSDAMPKTVRKNVSQNQKMKREGVLVDPFGKKVKGPKKTAKRPYTRKNAVKPEAAVANVVAPDVHLLTPGLTDSIAPLSVLDVSNKSILILADLTSRRLKIKRPPPAQGYDGQFEALYASANEFYCSLVSGKQYYADTLTMVPSGAQREKFHNIHMFCKWNEKSAEQFLALLIAAKFDMTTFTFMEFVEPSDPGAECVESSSTHKETNPLLSPKEVEDYNNQCAIDFITSITPVQLESTRKVEYNSFGFPVASHLPIIQTDPAEILLTAAETLRQLSTQPLFEGQDISKCFDNIPAPKAPKQRSPQGRKASPESVARKQWDTVRAMFKNRPRLLTEYIKLKEKFAANLYDPVSVRRFFELHEMLKQPIPHFPDAHNPDFVGSPVEFSMRRFCEKLEEERWINSMALQIPFKTTKLEKHIRVNAAFQPTNNVSVKELYEFYTK
ncbi:hypothetical protein GCK72_022122 [Caenorhabditis remanei]|uniref:Uncharacterized protein n=1 Tax=Caenorhabditis remanei TaxID=31234 RepID=A0A6A5FT39_CAERE|nr:hypothetical protein GCK72_022122 [Caenorhabditis remanei]KAF1745675.1 hypothetical protein GCK72_022122 [Caenorhabditis remanei]